MVIVGGSGYFFGPFLGALIAVLLPEWLGAPGMSRPSWADRTCRRRSGASTNSTSSSSLFVMALLVWSPTGLFGLADRWIAERKTRAARGPRRRRGHSARRACDAGPALHRRCRSDAAGRGLAARKTVLQVEGLKSFGGIAAVDGV